MKHTTRTRSTRTTLALAGAGALVASLGVGGIAHASGTSTAATRPATQGIVWLDDLLHPIDVGDAFMVRGTITSRVGSGDGTYGLSACTGDTMTSDVVGDGANLFFGVFTGRDSEDGKSFTMPQHVADQETVAKATSTYNDIVKQISACQDEPAGHWHYGPAHHVATHVGTITWMVTFDGDGTQEGGVAIARAGRHLAVVEAVGAGTTRQVEGLAADTLARVR